MGAFDRLLQLQIGPSRRLGIAIALAYGMALLILAGISGLPWWARLALALLVVTDGVRQFRRFALGLGDGVVELLLLKEGAARARRRRGELQDCTLLPGGLIVPWLTVLPLLLSDGGRSAAVLVTDNCDQDEFRRLRVRLRLKPAPSPADL